MTGNCCVFKFLRRSVDENIRCFFREKPPFSILPGKCGWANFSSRLPGGKSKGNYQLGDNVDDYGPCALPAKGQDVSFYLI